MISADANYNNRPSWLLEDLNSTYPWNDYAPPSFVYFWTSFKWLLLEMFAFAKILSPVSLFHLLTFQTILSDCNWSKTKKHLPFWFTQVCWRWMMNQRWYDITQVICPAFFVTISSIQDTHENIKRSLLLGLYNFFLQLLNIQHQPVA